MSLGKSHDLSSHIGNARDVACEPEPEKFDLVLGNQSDRARGAYNWKDVGQVMRTARNHRRGRSRP